jgi:hypothetical protein
MEGSAYRSKIGGVFYMTLPLMVLVATVWYYLQNSIIWTIICILAIAVLMLIIIASVVVYKKISYTITENSVRIKSPHGIIDILFSKITSVDTERDEESVYYGMSRDVVRIKFGTFSSVIISPNNKKGFLDELKAAGLNIE